VAAPAHCPSVAGGGRPPEDLVRVAAIRSPPLRDLLARQNLESSNFHAEVLTKLLGARTSGGPGTLATGAQAIEEYASSGPQSEYSNPTDVGHAPLRP
jgi:D-alanyl-D-alanine carboxypeptidase